MAHRRAGAVAVAGLLILAVTGIWSYSHQAGYRNQQYVMPIREIAAEIDRQSAEKSVVLVDTPNSDFVALRYCLGPGRRVLETREATVRTIWFLRSPHDVTPEQLDQRFEAQLRAAMAAKAEWFGPFSPLERRALGALGMERPPQYFQELLKFER